MPTSSDDPPGQGWQPSGSPVPPPADLDAWRRSERRGKVVGGLALAAVAVVFGGWWVTDNLALYQRLTDPSLSASAQASVTLSQVCGKSCWRTDARFTTAADRTVETSLTAGAGSQQDPGETFEVRYLVADPTTVVPTDVGPVLAIDALPAILFVLAGVVGAVVVTAGPRIGDLVDRAVKATEARHPPRP